MNDDGITACETAPRPSASPLKRAGYLIGFGVLALGLFVIGSSVPDPAPPPADALPVVDISSPTATLLHAVAAGDAEAQYQMGLYLLQTKEVDKDGEAAKELFLKAAGQNHAAACYELAVLNSENDADGEWPEERRIWLERAAELGEPRAQFAIGMRYLGGDGYDKDERKAVEAFRAAAEAGHVGAQRRMGICCKKGVGVESDAADAAHWFGKASQQGDAYSAFEYAVALLEGTGVAVNTADALAMLHTLAATGHAKATFRLGLCYAKGIGVAPDDNEATLHFLNAAQQGLTFAKTLSASRLISGTGIQKNPKLGIAMLREAAADDDVAAQSYLAQCLADGIGTERNPPEAAQWAKKAADQGDPESQCRYGLFLFWGSGVNKDSAEALRYWLLAANQGDPWGQRLLAIACFEGTSVKPNPQEGINWAKLAANQGDSKAQFILAETYAAGRGVAKNPNEALRWYVAASESGYSMAQASFGHRLITGDGLPKDVVKGREWLTRSAAQGNAQGQYSLARVYLNGTGVPRNRKLAYFWACLAAADEDLVAARELARELESRLTPEDISHAQQLAADFVVKPEHGRAEADMPTDLGKTTRFGSGSGFFITTNGYFVTNFHVIDDAKTITIKTATGTYEASIVRSDPRNDIALLKVEGEFTALHVRGSRGLRISDRVATVGYPTPDIQGLSPKYSSGEVSALSGINDDARMIQISVPIQPGNSGGPLVDTSGSVVGVVVSALNKVRAMKETGTIPENVNYAIKGTILLGIIEAVPEVARRLVATAPGLSDSPADIAAHVEAATGLVLVAK